MKQHRKHQRSQIARAWDDEPGTSVLQCNEAPDMSGANAAAVKGAQISQEQLDWVKGVYAEEAPARAAAAARADHVAARDDQVAQAAMRSMGIQDQMSQQQMALAQESADHYRTTFKPLETYIAKDAMEYDTAGRREAASGQAMADVQTQADIARADQQRNMAAMGVDPGSGAAAAALAQGGIMTAAAKAAAGNAARTNVETIAHGRLMDAAGLGRGVVSSQGTQAGLALSGQQGSVGAGSAAVGAGAGVTAAGAAGIGAMQSGVGMMQGGYGQAINGLNQSANTMTNIGKVQADVNASNSQGMGSLAGAGMMAFAV